MRYYVIPEDEIDKALNHESITQGNIDLRQMLRHRKAVELAPTGQKNLEEMEATKLRPITSADFEGAVKSVKSLVTSYEHTVDQLKTKLASTADRLEEITIDNANRVEENKTGYHFEANVRDWELNYSAENLWVQEMMEVVIDYANAKGVRVLIDKLKFKND